jgi:hypothetical protein
MCYNKHHILYIVMHETTKFTSHMCHEPQPIMWEKPHSLVVIAHIFTCHEQTHYVQASRFHNIVDLCAPEFNIHFDETFTHVNNPILTWSD